MAKAESQLNLQIAVEGIEQVEAALRLRESKMHLDEALDQICARDAVIASHVALGADYRRQIANLLACLGAHVHAGMHAGTMPDSAADGVLLAQRAAWWLQRADEWAGDELLREAAEVATRRAQPAMKAELMRLWPRESRA